MERRVFIENTEARSMQALLDSWVVADAPREQRGQWPATAERNAVTLSSTGECAELLNGH